MKRFAAFIKKEMVLSVSFAAAVISMFFVLPDGEYFSYIDFKVLCLLFCLMAVVAGFGELGVFRLLSEKLLVRCGSARALVLVLTMLPFFTSMLLTNDVALITFVPFAILILTEAREKKLLIPTVVLQTLAANLGSMATPVGNPQNLFLYSYFELSAGEFFLTVLPPAGISLVLLLAAMLLVPKAPLKSASAQSAGTLHKGKLLLFSLLFLLCLASVFRLLNHWVLLGVVAAALFVFHRSLFKKVDYCLLVTFVCFFVFAGNMGRLPAVYELLAGLMETAPLLTPVLASQVISNVPAAVLLSGFTETFRELLLGVNIGGLGTPVASLASLISMKYYFASSGAEKGKYLLWFTVGNIAGLIVLLLAAPLLP